MQDENRGAMPHCSDLVRLNEEGKGLDGGIMELALVQVC